MFLTISSLPTVLNPLGCLTFQDPEEYFYQALKLVAALNNRFFPSHCWLFLPPVIIKSPCSTQLFPSIPQFSASVFCFIQHARRLQSSGEEGEVPLRHHTSLHPVHRQCCFRQTLWVKQMFWSHVWRSCVVVFNGWHHVIMSHINVVAGVENLNCK